MGIFSTGKEISVSSTVYNLAGDIKDRPDYMKTTVVGAVMNSGKTKDSLADGVSRAYLKGPGMQIRSFGKWARNSGYSLMVGQPPGALILTQTINKNVLLGQIPKLPGQEVLLQASEIGVPDYTYWVDRYMAQNHLNEVETNYSSNFNEITKVITVIRENGTIETFTPTDYVAGARYLYANYNLTESGVSDPLVVGPDIFYNSLNSLPSTNGWTQNSYTSTGPTTMALNTTTVVEKTYSDNRPVETSATSNTTQSYTYTPFSAVYEKTEYVGKLPGLLGLRSTRYVMGQDVAGVKETNTTVSTSTETIAGGVVRTTKTTTTADSLKLVIHSRTDSQNITVKSWFPMQVLIYRQGSGNAVLDSLFAPLASGGWYFPYIPIRINNEFISESFAPAVYMYSKKALKKATGGNFDKIVDKLKDNPSLGDIDYAYAVFGCSLNTPEMTAKRYIYEFFQEVMLGEDLQGIGLNAMLAAVQEARQRAATWNAWVQGQNSVFDPLYGTPEPPQPSYPTFQTYGLRINSNAITGMNYDMSVLWNGIVEKTGSGQLRPGAKEGDLWFEYLPNTIQTGSLFLSESLDPFNMTLPDTGFVRLNWQTGANSWRHLDIYGLIHRNMIYGGKYVEISGAQALSSVEESGFIIPLHEDIVRRMPLVDSTQLSTACCYLVLNSYQIVKQKWYQTGWFKVLLIVAIIIITVVTMGSGGALAGGSGLLGANVAVGTALGASVATAAIVGAVANAIAAMVLTQIISYGSTAIFGEKVGAIVAVVTSFIALNVGTALANNTSFAASISKLATAENILKLTEAAGKGYAGYVNAETAETVRDINKLNSDYQEQSKVLQDMYKSVFGEGNSGADLGVIIDATKPQIESPDAFFARTLLTGSEIVEMSLAMVNDFAEMTLSTELPT